MADTQTQDTSPSPDIASLVGGDDKGLLSGFQSLYQGKAAEDRAITGAADYRMSRDQARADAAFKAEGVSAAELPKPWNAEEEHKKFEHNPIEGFGSVGGLFAMVASAFTKAPMENAINGMAGAINSIKAGDEAAYERAHQAWQENTKLALERFKTQHELYSDAMSLMDHDMSAANAKMHNAAVRFGDSQMLMLAEHGMVKEMFELQASRATAAEKMDDYRDKATFRFFQKSAIEAKLKEIPPTGDPNKDKLIRAVEAMKILDPHGKIGSAEQEAVGNYVMKTNPNDPHYVDGLIDIQQRMHPQRGGGTGNSSQAIKARAIEELRAKHPDWDTGQLEHEYNLERAVPTGNQIDALQGRIDQAERVIDGSEKNLEFLHTYKGGAGLMGKIMRGEEIAENITGISTQTDRVAFRRRVHELQEMAPRILVDANGRPLKAEQDKVADIVAGLQAGDTSPNTIRAYEDLIKDMKVRIQKYRERQQGKVAPSSGAGGGSSGGSTDWLSAYPEKK